MPAWKQMSAATDDSLLTLRVWACGQVKTVGYRFKTVFFPRSPKVFSCVCGSIVLCIRCGPTFASRRVDSLTKYKIFPCGYCYTLVLNVPSGGVEDNSVSCVGKGDLVDYSRKRNLSAKQLYLSRLSSFRHEDV